MRQQLEQALAAKLRVSVQPCAASALAQLAAGTCYELILCELDMGPQRDRIHRALGRERPELATNLVLMHEPEVAQPVRELLSSIGIWHVRKTASLDALARELGALYRLWCELGLEGAL